MKRTGIYRIRNKVTNESYVGLAEDIDKRWKQHRHKLKQGMHHAIKLQASYNAHGMEAFEFSVLELCDLSNLITKELAWMQAVRPVLNTVYGFSPTGEDITPLLKSREAAAFGRQRRKIAVREGVPSECKYCGDRVTGKVVCNCGVWLKTCCQECHDELRHGAIPQVNMHFAGSKFSLLNTPDRDSDQ